MIYSTKCPAFKKYLAYPIIARRASSHQDYVEIATLGVEAFGLPEDQVEKEASELLNKCVSPVNACLVA
ncbi:hypothetical protein Tco_1222876, partial [Tanacetum coccineum]